MNEVRSLGLAEIERTLADLKAEHQGRFDAVARHKAALATTSTAA